MIYKACGLVATATFVALTSEVFNIHRTIKREVKKYDGRFERVGTAIIDIGYAVK